MTINYFYQGVDEVGDLAALGVAEDGDEGDLAGMIDANAIDLVTAYQSIPDPRLRKSLLDAVKAAAESFSRNATFRDETESSDED